MHHDPMVIVFTLDAYKQLHLLLFTGRWPSGGGEGLHIEQP